MRRAELLEKTRNVVLPVLDSLGYGLVEIALVSSHGRRVLQVFIDCARGVTLDDCARVSRAVSEHLDREDLFPGRYVLEVSSPGAERRLRGREDFEHFAGRKARLRFRRADGKVGEATGRIAGLAQEALVFQPEGEAEINIPLDDVLGGRLAL